MRQSLADRASRPQTGETAPSVALRALRSTARAVDIVRRHRRRPTLHCRRTSRAGFAPAGRARPTSPRRASRLRVFAARQREPAHCAVRSEFALIRPCLTVARAAGPRRGGRHICAQPAPGIRCGGAAGGPMVHGAPLCSRRMFRRPPRAQRYATRAGWGGAGG